MAACLLALPARAAPVRFAITPGPVQIGFRAFGLGLMPIDGIFGRFDGILTLDNADPQTCSLSLHAETGSLRLPRQVMTDDALGPDLLDVAHYPDLRLEGSCQERTIRGSLELHGVQHPVVLDVTIGKGVWQASGLIRRAEWGMGARPLLAGPEVRISITAGMPPGFAATP